MKITGLLFLILFTTMVFAQHPVKWKFNAMQTQSEMQLKFNADIEKGWHIYSQFTPDGGPLPMLFTYDSSKCYNLVGKTEEPKPIEEFDSVFAITVRYLENKQELTQKVNVISTPCKITGRIEYQACKDACIPLDTTFIFTIPKK